MKLFNDGTSKSQGRYKFKSFYSFKLINETKPNEAASSYSTNNYPQYLFGNTSKTQATAVTGFNPKQNKELFLNESSTNFPLVNDSCGGGLEDNLYLSQMQSVKTAASSSYSAVSDIFNNFTNGGRSKKPKLVKIHLRGLRHKKSVFNIGRWTEDEHRRFIEAILKYGNDWKNVQKHIRTRSSTQSRSHSQKFFLKIKNYDLFDFKDRKPCISSLNELAKNLDEKQIEKMTDLLISYEYQDCPERKPVQEKMLLKKRKKEIYSLDFEMENDSVNRKASIYNSNMFTRSGKQGQYFNGKSSNALEASKVQEQAQYSNNQTVANDDFKDHFFKAFNNKNRRLSFEDNFLLLFRTEMMKEEDTQELSFGKKKESNRSFESSDYSESIAEDTAEENEEDGWVDTIIDFTQNYVMV
eukprot:CAMPEP_0170513758 /NCGR_PEP_ID=MMETSP0209-20121228/306_1 /TAXON_ID=665100 ORGANISM="Litonotus pictus, Strain P1" /NCGR_SAMPLE_ID=MMETSP0209 /ASSEMBLY_ACC=CAM_ASM_000301 /LENGTH=410 /DNA_ID=CAMNT_0010797569 /DNA_START=1 /DNA_END=1233 /DNA_ORIENTATION=+